MSHPLPHFSPEEFDRALASFSAEPLSPAARDSLYRHYQELRTWNTRLSLVGPGTADEVLARHYGEALAALHLLPVATENSPRLVDLGSGAGFPGVVLAAARPGYKVTLVEARQKKWAFLSVATRKASLPCECLNVRVSLPLPEGLPESIDFLTLRALRLPPAILKALEPRLHGGTRLLIWSGVQEPELPDGFQLEETVELVGSEHRRIRSFRLASPSREHRSET